MSGQRTGVLELAVLGLLHETPMHGSELRKRLNSVLGAFRAFGYGSLYPCLKDLTARGLIAEDDIAEAAKPLAGRRSKIVYRLTADGKEHLQDLPPRARPPGKTTARRSVRLLRPHRGRCQARILRAGAPARRAGRGAASGPVQDQERVRQLHPRAAAARPGVGRARGPLAERADRVRAAGGRRVRGPAREQHTGSC
jgi:DNA-binding PadR family transcriptional regulator